MTSSVIKTVGSDQTVTGIDIIPITPDDDVDLDPHVRAIRCKNTGTSGALVIRTFIGEDRTTHIVAGETLEVYASRVLASGTTATGLEGIV